MIWKVKRSLYVFFWVEDTAVFGVSEFLQGELRASSKQQLLALSLLTGARHPVDEQELRLLAALPAERWSAAADVRLDAARLADLAARGLLVSDSGEPELARLRRRDELLNSQQWHPYAAFYHFMTREREKNAGLPWVKLPKTEDLAMRSEEDASRFANRFGPPPPPFHHASGSLATTELPLIEKAGGLYEVLTRRKSIRAFESDEPLPLEDLAILLRYVFGCHGYARLSPEVVVLHKTSPSGGSLHPIEAYPLILNVESLATGFHHYDAENHSLELISQIESPAARDLAVEISGGQNHAGGAHVLIVLTARFLRHYWKYRQRSQAYGSVLVDAGHLSQTLYLVATDLGLGAFYSAVVDGPRVEEILGLEAQEEGVLGICACGIKAREGPDLGLDFQPYKPRDSAL